MERWELDEEDFEQLYVDRMTESIKETVKNYPENFNYFADMTDEEMTQDIEETARAFYQREHNNWWSNDPIFLTGDHILVTESGGTYKELLHGHLESHFEYWIDEILDSDKDAMLYFGHAKNIQDFCFSVVDRESFYLCDELHRYADGDSVYAIPDCDYFKIDFEKEKKNLKKQFTWEEVALIEYLNLKRVEYDEYQRYSVPKDEVYKIITEKEFVTLDRNGSEERRFVVLKNDDEDSRVVDYGRAYEIYENPYDVSYYIYEI